MVSSSMRKLREAVGSHAVQANSKIEYSDTDNGARCDDCDQGLDAKTKSLPKEESRCQLCI